MDKALDAWTCRHHPIRPRIQSRGTQVASSLGQGCPLLVSPVTPLVFALVEGNLPALVTHLSCIQADNAVTITNDC